MMQIFSNFKMISEYDYIIIEKKFNYKSPKSDAMCLRTRDKKTW